MRTVITGGTLVTADAASPMDVLVQDEKVAALAAGFSGLSETWQEAADRVVDATGKYVVPGGIDAHTHMEMPFGEPCRPTRSRQGRGRQHGVARQ